METKGTQAGSKETPSTEYLLKQKAHLLTEMYKRWGLFKNNQTYFS